MGSFGITMTVSLGATKLASRYSRPARSRETLAVVKGPSGTVTFLFTDIAGSTRLWETAPTAMSAAVERHDALVRDAVGRNGGTIFATGGDGFAAAFARADDAVRAAVAAQRSLQTETWPPETPILTRIGLHTGEADERNDDYFGPAVNLAARIMAATVPGHIVASHVTATVARGTAGVRFIDLRAHRLNGIAEAMALFAVHADGLTAQGRSVTTTAPRRGNLRAPATEFVGRLTNVSKRASALPGQRLVTLTGRAASARLDTQPKLRGCWPTHTPMASGSLSSARSLTLPPSRPPSPQPLE